MFKLQHNDFTKYFILALTEKKRTERQQARNLLSTFLDQKLASEVPRKKKKKRRKKGENDTQQK